MLRMNCTVMNNAVAQGTANSRNTQRLGLVAPGSRWLIFPSTNSRATSSVSDSIFSEIRNSRARTGPKTAIRPGLISSDTPSADGLAEAIPAARKRAQEDQQQAAIAEGP